MINTKKKKILIIEIIVNSLKNTKIKYFREFSHEVFID